MTTKAELIKALEAYPDDIELFDSWDDEPLVFEPALGTKEPALWFYGRKDGYCQKCGDRLTSQRQRNVRIDKPSHCFDCALAERTMEFEETT